MAEARRQQLGALLKLSPQAIAILDADGGVREWNPAAAALLGRERTDVLGLPLAQLLPVDERAPFAGLWSELPASRRARVCASTWSAPDGHSVMVEMLLAPIQDRDGVFAGVVATMTALGGPVPDTFPARELDRPSSGLEVDELTGLPGRRWLQRLLVAPVPEGQQRAVAVLDLDAFALVNQDFGPDAGDALLQEFGARLEAVSQGVAVGRWQADEFVCVLDADDAGDRMAALVERVAAAAREPFVLGEDELRLSLSAGVATTAHAQPVALFPAASAAMAQAKDRGRDCAVWFSHGTAPTAGGSGLRLANDLHKGLAEGELRLHYQPIIDLSTNDVAGVEALVRWQRPGVGLLSPAAFIEVAERTGQIVALGAWVIRQACATAAALAAQRLAPLPVSINVSARQLSDPDLVSILERALRESGCPPSSIVVEVTESAVLRDIAAATAVLETIAGLGVDLDLDDFGTGYSSLLYLKHFPVARIKIDRSFVAGLGCDVADTAIVASTIALAHSIGLTAIAEGVETPDQLTVLRQLGCDYAQGYLLCHPLPEEELTTWLSQQLPSRLLPRGDDGDVVDPRDQVGDARDRVGDDRDGIADARDVLADQRDRAADLREAASAGPAGPVSAGAPSDRHEEARRAAGRARSRASADRQRGQDARAQAEGDRQQSAQDRRATGHDRLSGAYLLDTGMEALRAAVAQAHQVDQPLTLACVVARTSASDQLTQDAYLVVLANALGAAVRDSDVLVRHAPAGFLCAMPDLDEVSAARQLDGMQRALRALPEFEPADVGLAELQPAETLEQLVARALGAVIA